MITLEVSLGERAYPIFIGQGLLAQTNLLRPFVKGRRALIVTNEVVAPLYLGAVREALGDVQCDTLVLPDGEHTKTLQTLSLIYDKLLAERHERSTTLVALGGGVIGDITGFAAATYQRGVNFIQVPTTLLSQVDSSVGGKTGVNIPEGKNLVGAFWQPSGVVCDLSTLDSLSDREMRCGLGEMAKYHFIVREDLSSLSMVDRIARCVRIKADIVAADEREGGIRALLNYGHTLAHALEIATDFSIAHGEAVAIGVLYAAHLAHRMGRIDSARVDQHYDVVHGVYGLRHSLPNGITPDQLIIDMGRDKKAIDSITFVLDSATGLEVVSGISNEKIREALTDLITRLS